MNWKDNGVLVTGGASFIGSHLVEALLSRGARVRVVDDLSSGRLANLEGVLTEPALEFLEGDLSEPERAARAVDGCAVVFHLAADHGGRGYVDLHQSACAGNLLLDGTIFRACVAQGVKKIVYASSGCVYPNYLQEDTSQELYLTEEMVGPPYDADNLYGWAKLMGEMTLKALYREQGVSSVSCRYFTVYGNRGHENHAVIAMIARAFVGQDPFEVWGTGEQVRNWTHVSDIVSGTIAAAERVDDGTSINLGTTERTRVIDAVRMILEQAGLDVRLKLRPEMPTGPLNRVADNRRARQLLEWEPKVGFADGVRETLQWYFETHDREAVRHALGRRLTERR